MKKKILVLGSNGLVGSHFVDNSNNYILKTPTSAELDISNSESTKKYFEEYNPDWIVNFAAITDVTEAEKQSDNKSGSVWKTNVQGVSNLLDNFKSKNFIQISSNMVFSGSVQVPGPYSEDEPIINDPSLLTWYGWSKNRAEVLVLERGGTVLRINHPVRAQFPNKTDIIRSLLQKIAKNELKSLYNDQQIAISYIPEITDTLLKIIENDKFGVFHCSTDTVSPFELLSWTLKQLDSNLQVEPTSLAKSDFYKKNPLRYSMYGALKTKDTENNLETHFSSWQTAVELLINDGLVLPR